MMKLIFCIFILILLTIQTRYIQALDRTSSRIVRVVASSVLARKFWIVLPPKVKIKNSTSSVYSSLYYKLELILYCILDFLLYVLCFWSYPVEATTFRDTSYQIFGMFWDFAFFQNPLVRPDELWRLENKSEIWIALIQKLFDCNN